MRAADASRIMVSRSLHGGLVEQRMVSCHCESHWVTHEDRNPGQCARGPVSEGRN